MATKKKVPAKKKKVPTKKKTPAKKKATKKVVDPHLGKRYFMLEFSGLGGEYIVGSTTKEFVEYWLNEENEHGLADHVMGMHEGALSHSDDILDEEDADEVTLDLPEGFDENSPEVSEGVKYIEYWELGDIEHDTVVSKDYSSFSLSEIKLHSDAVYQNGEVTWDDKKSSKRNFDWSQEMFTVVEDSESEHELSGVNTVFSIEQFVHDTKKGLVDPVPVVMIYDSQKGTFGRVYIQTNGEDFDMDKFAVSVCENNMTEYVMEYFYNKESLTMDNNYLSTWGKGFTVSVGYMPKGETSYNREELLKEGWELLGQE